MLGGFWTWQAYSGKNPAARDVAAVVEEKPGIKVHLPQKKEPKMKEVPGTEARLMVEAKNKELVKMEPQAAKALAAAPVPAPVSAPAAAASALALNTEQRGMSRGDVERLKRVQDEKAYGLDFGGAQMALSPVAEPLPLQGGTLSASNSLIVTATGAGETTRRVEPMVLGGSMSVMNGSGVLAGAESSRVQQGAGMGALTGLLMRESLFSLFQG